MKSSLSRAPRRALHGLVALSWLAASVSGPHFASAQGGADGASEDLRALFPQRARIETGGVYGLVRAPLPAGRGVDPGLRIHGTLRLSMAGSRT